MDLIAHSQGGVVVEAFLTLIYKRDDRSFPPLGTVVTLSSPLRGDPLADAMARIRASTSGDRALRVADAVGRSLGMRTGATSDAVRDLASGSELRKRIDAARLPDEVEVTTIGSATDYVVPGNFSALPGGSGTIVIPNAIERAHRDPRRSGGDSRAVRSALEGKPLPCQSLLTAVAGNVLPITISALEELEGDGLAALGHLSEGKL